MSLDRFDAVSLDELVAQAPLLTRVDRKYVVLGSTLDGLLDELDPATRVLEIDGLRALSYESVYFDTPDLLSFRMAAQPRRRRFKLRTRGYLDTATAYLEVKTRGARGTTVKERTEYAFAQRLGLTCDAREEVADAFAAIGIDPDRVESLRPTVVTAYRRSTLLHPGAAARATIDTDLVWRESATRGFALPHVAIVETKSGATASAIDRLLWRRGVRAVSVSKYATGLATLHPELPRNRWARLLRGPLWTTTRTEELSCAA